MIAAAARTERDYTPDSSDRFEHDIACPILLRQPPRQAPATGERREHRVAL